MDIFFDLETIPDPNSSVDEYLEKIEAPGNYKKPESIEKWKQEKGREEAEQQYRKTALDGLYGEICSIAWAIDDDEVQSYTRDESLSEAALLSRFLQFISEAKSRTRPVWVGHNILEFDLKFLQQRFWVNNINPAEYGVVLPVNERHGTHVFDTMKAWAGWRGYVKQDALCKAFGLPVSDMDGSQVYDAWLAGEYEKIREYNESDVETVRELYRRMR